MSQLRSYTLSPTKGIVSEFASAWSAISVAESEDNKSIARQIKEFREHYLFPVSRLTEDPFVRFYTLLQQWSNETGNQSLMIHKVMHPSYQKIIGMGAQALPFIFSELQRNPDHWFWALKAITGVDPVSPSNRGKISNMVQDWLEWAKQKGYVS